MARNAPKFLASASPQKKYPPSKKALSKYCTKCGHHMECHTASGCETRHAINPGGLCGCKDLTLPAIPSIA